MQQQGSNWREPPSAQGADGDAAVLWGGRVDFAQRLTRLFEHTSRPDGRRWTLQHVADQCTARGQQVTRQYVLHLKSGARSEPRLNLVEALADVFGVPVAYFTADHAGRMTADLLPLLLAMSDPRARALLTRDDAADVLAALAAPQLGDLTTSRDLPAILGALADHRVQAVIQTVLADPVTPATTQQPR
ncbi:MAG: helix-turn-helix transcriptional regulator [Candidatus Nanopelagicales bacterium]